MATKEIVEWECDLCGSTAPSAAVGIRDAMPKGWIELIMRSNAGYHFELSICAKCSSVVLTTVRERAKD